MSSIDKGTFIDMLKGGTKTHKQATQVVVAKWQLSVVSKLISKRLNKNIETKERTNLVETFAVIGVLAKAVHSLYP